jgi:hypothetical protein
MPGYAESVFVNCPFDQQYQDLFDAVNFAIYDCGFVARSVLELPDAGKTRISKITSLIAQCGLGVHDLSRTELDEERGLPRFNMPLELGIFLGAQWLGTKKQRDKKCLVFDREKYRYQKFCSDIAGQDITPHSGDPKKAVRAVRNWLSNFASDVVIPSGSTIHVRYLQFREDLPLYSDAFKLDPDDLTFRDFSTLVSAWLRENGW